jgi:hypothetical protein
MVASLVALIALGIRQGRSLLPGFGIHVSPFASSPPDTKPTVDTPSKSKGKVTRSVRRKPHDGGSEDQAVLPSSISSDMSTTTIVVPLPPVPTARNIAVGTTRQQLRVQYGDPTLAAAATENGLLFEKYYYATPDRSRITVATLYDGRVIYASNIVP